MPWKDLTIANEDYLTAGSLPADTILCEPSKLKQFAVINMWNFWKKKQVNGQRGLSFQQAKKEDMRHQKVQGNKGKAKTPSWVDPDVSIRSPSPTSTHRPSEKAGSSKVAGPSRTSTHLGLPPSTTLASPSMQPDSGSGNLPHPQPDQLPHEKTAHNMQLTPDAEAGRSHQSKASKDEESNDKDSDTDDDSKLDPQCPKYHMKTKKGRFLFLKSLSDDTNYRAMLRAMERIKVLTHHPPVSKT